MVIDNSVVLAWCLADEADAMADAAIRVVQRDGAIAPALWWYELRNALISNERRGRLQPADTDVTLSDLRDLAIELDRDHDEATVMALARRHKLSLYDAAYLEVAQRRNVALATLDRNLARACQAESVALFKI